MKVRDLWAKKNLGDVHGELLCLGAVSRGPHLFVRGVRELMIFSYTSLQERPDRRRSGVTAVGAERLRSAHHQGSALVTDAAVAARHKDVRALLVHAHDALRHFQLALALLRC